VARTPCDNRRRVPIYEYRCANGHEFEVFQKMTDEPVATCERCGAPVERVFHPVAVHFKGSGFYTTDYASKAKKDGKPEPEKSESKSSDSGEKAKTESGKD
jgi:putative FmdB family regulatory protein